MYRDNEGVYGFNFESLLRRLVALSLLPLLFFLPAIIAKCLVMPLS